MAIASLFFAAAAQAQDIKEHTLNFAVQPAKGTSQVLDAQKFADLNQVVTRLQACVRLRFWRAL